MSARNSNGVLPGGNYAILVIDHTATGLQNAWNQLFPVLQKHNLAIDQSHLTHLIKLIFSKKRG